MPKLFPPKIDNILPAFVMGTAENVSIKVPYYLNDAVGNNDYNKIQYSIKPVTSTSNDDIISGTVAKGTFNSEKKYYDLTISKPKSNFILGQYYKIQIAFKTSDNTIGYYSNAGIAKCVSQPTISVEQSNLRNFTGTFTDSQTYEKVYSYCFNLYDSFGNLLESSGVKIHNNQNNIDANTSEDYWESQMELKADTNYSVKYLVTTVNNFEGEISQSNIKFSESFAPRIESVLIAENNFEEGYNRIYLSRFFVSIENAICGNFILLRSSDKDNYSTWEKLIDFQIYNWTYEETDTYEIYKDFFIEQGRSYRYAIQAYNSQGVYSTKLINDNGPIFSDFEDIFLYDGEKQLKIRFNPKVSSFKTNLLESKQDTLGGKFPSFFRNGNVNYKEFGLSGLISLLSDNDENFFNGIIKEDSHARKRSEEISSNKNKVINVNMTTLSAENYQKERDFKVEVLSWLTNGKEKVLKTPAEGNYIVRLMNTSLSPNDTLGRLLHTFTSTAYEVADYNLTSLNALKFIEKSNPKKRKMITQNLNGTISPQLDENLKIDKAIIYTVPNRTITYTLKGSSTAATVNANAFGIADLTSIVKNVGLKSISVSSTWGPKSYIEYSYLNYVEDTSDWYYVQKVEPQENYNQTHGGQGIDQFMKSRLNTQTAVLPHFSYIQVQKKEIVTIYKKSDNGKYYTSKAYTTEVAFDTNKIYKINGTSKYISGDNPTKEINKSSGVFQIQFPEDRENLESLGTSEKEIYRDVEDFALGQGLKVTIKCPWKRITLSSTTPSGGKIYAI